MYTDSISKITFSGSKVLKPIWEANKYKLIYKDFNGKEKKVVDVEYGSKYEVESFEWGKDEAFKGWLKDGKPLEGSIVSVDKETDIVLIPIIENSEEDENNSQNESSISDDTFKKAVVVILCTISAALLVVAFKKRENLEKIVKKVLRKSDSKKGDKDDDA
jgi:small nuclear ribonucleoprotein (snRNP)-like protein